MKLFEAQQAVFKRLKTSIKTEIYDYVPENSTFPYVVLGEIESSPDLTKTTQSEKITLTIYIFSQFKGKAEIFEIANAIETALTDNLIIENVFLINQALTSASAFETNADFFQGTLKFEMLVQLI